MTVESSVSAPVQHSPAPDAQEPLSARETREIVTPYAFGVADELLGQPLASPWRRLFAQCIDASIVVLLSTAHALVLAFFVAITFFRAGKHLAEGEKKRSFARKMLRLSGACLLFFITYIVVESYNAAPDVEDISSDSPFVSAGLQVAQKYAWRACEGDNACQLEVASGFGEAFGNTGESEEDALSQFDDFLVDKGLSEQQEEALRTAFINQFTTSKASDNKAAKHVNEAVETAIREGIRAGGVVTANPPSAPQPAELTTDPEPPKQTQVEEPTLKFGLGKDNDTSKSNSLISWVDGLIKDLGLGFGWAALYYSVLTAWWRGHTIGKRILKIKVIKLDGSPLNLWESFGRYGGYTAGIATGLLGFLQIFWDPNRQTIQDKIAETLVLYRPAGSVPLPELIKSQSDATQTEPPVTL